MSEGMVTTGVDDLLAYLKGREKVAMQDAAAVLNIPLETVQAWVDFLVEEKILGIEYKFTKPYIYLNKEEQKPKAHIIERTAVPLEEVKQQYFAHAQEKKIPASKIAQLWRDHVQQTLEAKKEYFMEQARKRRVEEPERLYERYVHDLLARC